MSTHTGKLSILYDQVRVANGRAIEETFKDFSDTTGIPGGHNRFEVVIEHAKYFHV